MGLLLSLCKKGGHVHNPYPNPHGISTHLGRAQKRPWPAARGNGPKKDTGFKFPPSRIMEIETHMDADLRVVLWIWTDTKHWERCVSGRLAGDPGLGSQRSEQKTDGPSVLRPPGPPFSFPPLQVSLYLSLLSPGWLPNPPECVEDTLDIRRGDRVPGVGRYLRTPGGITGLQTVCTAGPFYFFFSSLPSIVLSFSSEELWELPPNTVCNNGV